jgi:sarcosine oxidase subunit gamma
MADLSLVRPLSGQRFQVRTAQARTIVRLKSWQPSRTDRTPLALAGCTLPDSVGRVTEGLPRILCTAPDEWLLVYAPTSVARLRNILAPELSAQSLVLVDLTDGLVVLEVSGTGVRDVIARSCGLDLDPQQFRAGQCARTRFAQIPVVIDCIQDPGVFHLYAPRSYATWLTDWLNDARIGLGGLPP